MYRTPSGLLDGFRDYIITATLQNHQSHADILDHIANETGHRPSPRTLTAALARWGLGRVDLNEFQTFITEAIRDKNLPRSQILDHILRETGVRPGLRTLERYVAEQGLASRKKWIDSSPELDALITEATMDHRKTDSDIVVDLRAEGFDVSARWIAHRRKQLGLRKRVEAALQPQAQELLEADLRREYDEGFITEYGRGYLYQKMRAKYHHVGRARLHVAAKKIYPQGFERRSKQARHHRGKIITPGPNFCWSMDGHCKLERHGFQIYAAIDVYSR